MTRPQEDIVDLDRSVDPPGLRVEPASAWLAEHVPAMRPPYAFGLIAAGGSNLTYRIDDADGRRFILRRPPVAAVLASAHDVAREHRIMAALRDTDVPVPEMMAFCRDAAVTGAPFYVIPRPRQRCSDLNPVVDLTTTGGRHAVQLGTSGGPSRRIRRPSRPPPEPG
jgi:aminoglycoside phosphotransferase (APT) family kinase protein